MATSIYTKETFQTENIELGGLKCIIVYIY
nr:MAG TPA: hypothetical protein [Caudoviricetes sp.]